MKTGSGHSSRCLAGPDRRRVAVHSPVAAGCIHHHSLVADRVGNLPGRIVVAGHIVPVGRTGLGRNHLAGNSHPAGCCNNRRPAGRAGFRIGCSRTF